MATTSGHTDGVHGVDRLAWLVLAGATAYATARYQLAKDVSWSDWPTATLNKSLALTALALLPVAVWRRRLGLGQVGRVMAAAAAAGAAHILLSLALLDPATFAKFYAQGRLTAAAGGAIALGTLATVALAAGARPQPQRAPDAAARRLAALAFVLGTHAALPGISSWLAPATWPAGMPPITLMSFLLGLAALAAAWLPRLHSKALTPIQES